MFQYIALAWNDTLPTASATAQRLSRALHAHPSWYPATVEPGLHVFTSGSNTGVNGAYRLSPFKGVVLGKLFRRSELGRASTPDLQLSEAEIERISRTDGRALVSEFWGGYVAFLPSSVGSRVLRNPSGALPWYRLHWSGVGIAFSWLEGLLEALPALPLPDNYWDGLAAHLVQGPLSGVATTMNGVFHVPVGEIAELKSNGAALKPAWSAVDFARRPVDEAPVQAAMHLQQTVQACARAWANCHDALLLRLSGGLDSAILLSSLGPSDTRAEITCVKYHSSGADSDERQYARLAAARVGRPLVERECDGRYPLERVLDVALTPTPESCVGRLSMARMDAELAALHRATANDIPPQMATRRSKDGMEEHLTEVLRRNLPLARQLPLDGQLVQRDLLDRARVENPLSGRPSSEQAHVGEIHGCLAVEAWLQRWSSHHRARGR